MYSILMISHGNVAEAMAESLKMVCGNSKNFHSIGIDSYTAVEKLELEILEKVNVLRCLGDVILLSDFPLGTPFNVINQLVLKEKLIHITGINFPLLVDLAQNCEDIDNITPEFLDNIIEHAKTQLFDIRHLIRQE